MKTIFSIILFFSVCRGHSQQISCGKTNDTLLIFYVEIFKPKSPTEQFWSTAKQFNASSINTKSIATFVTSFLKDKNYCPSLPEGFREEAFKCFKDSAVTSIEKLENGRGSVYDLLDAIKKVSFKRNFTLEDGFRISLSIIRRYGTFLIRDVYTDELGSSSDEYYLDKKQLSNRIVFIPLQTFSSELTLW